ncbi:MAG: ATP-dependent DNA helicase [Corynebacterium sp.]|nr:ATP-dependent DNA helicase [Corynebacterium sp.]
MTDTLNLHFHTTEENPSDREFYTPFTTGLGPGIHRIIGKAGSGVTTAIIDSVCARLEEGINPDNIIVISGSKKSANRINKAIESFLLGKDPEFVSERAIARTMHALAYEILIDRARKNHQEFLPRLLAGAEQDVIIRELLDGQSQDLTADTDSYWPEDIRPAIGYVSFARELRDFLLRAVERNYSPAQLIEDGTRFNRPRWVAAGHFLKEYEQVMGLAGTEQVSGSELIVKATEALAEPALYQDWQQRVRYLYIDDAQNLEPLSARLLESLIPATASTIIAGCPDQSVFHFRGANGEFLRSYKPTHAEIQEHRFTTIYRQPKVRHALVARSPMEQYRFMADRMRRAHLLEGVPYSQMAVVTRSRAPFALIRQVFQQCNVPVRLPATEIVLNEEPLVKGLITAAQTLTKELSVEELEELLCGPLGGADSVLYTRLLRSVRKQMLEAKYTDEKATDTLPVQALGLLRNLLDPNHRNSELEQSIEDAILGSTENTPERIIYKRIRDIIFAGAEAESKDQGLELIFWAMWEATGLSRSLQDRALRGGTIGAQATHDLDAMMNFFDFLGDFVERNPGAKLLRFINSVEEQSLPFISRERGIHHVDAVNLLTAHSTQGEEWTHVFIAQVNQGVWPNLDHIGTLFGLEEFLDYVDNGIIPGEPNPYLLARLGEEKRLFNLALARATEELYVLATDEANGEEPVEPSMYLDQMAAAFGYEDKKAHSIADFYAQRTEETPLENPEEPLDYQTRMRVYSREDLVAELRRIVCNIGVDSYSELARTDAREQAAAQLRRLKEAGVSGADPRYWEGLIPLSIHGGISKYRGRNISPSRLKELLACPLHYLFSRLGSFEESYFIREGRLVHAYAEALVRGMDEEEARATVVNAFKELESDVIVKADEADFTAALDKARNYLNDSAAKRNYPEISLSIDMEEDFRVTGRLDLLQLFEDRARIVDFKYSQNKTVNAYLHQLVLYAIGAGQGVINLSEKRIVDANRADAKKHRIQAIEHLEAQAVTLKGTAGYAQVEVSETGDYSMEQLDKEALMANISMALDALDRDEIPGCGQTSCPTCTTLGLADPALS